MKRITIGGMAGVFLTALLLLQPRLALGQTNNLDFNNASANVEGAIRLSWNSSSNEIYEIDYADALVDTNTGTITWNVLYEDYPSQGTNTFWLDTGNYSSDPMALHPSQSPMRFYRVLVTGTNNTPTIPTISITTPATNDSLTGEVYVTVSAFSDQPFLATKLYVDGQEMNLAISSTNWTDISGTNFVQDTYVLNTCEWPNGDHTIFATARVQTGASGAHDVGDPGRGYAVSGFVPVTFSNLVTRISFSQPFFTPEDGQTQHVSAIFTANVDWTLEIQDATQTTVRTATGSGGRLDFDWDGTGDGGTDLPVGSYTYLITAQTNGAALLDLGGSGGGGSGDGPPILSFASAGSVDEPTQLWVQFTNGSVVPLGLFPPGFDTNGLTILEEPVSWNPFALAFSSRSTASRSAFASVESAASSSSGGASSQSSRSPKRPPIKPVKGRAGVYGFAYDTYSANGTNGISVAPPLNGVLTQRLGLEGLTAGQSTFTYGPLKRYKEESSNFVEAMKNGNWSQGFAKVDDKLKISDLRGSGTIFNTVKLGILMLHGTYGTGQDFTAGGCKQMYFPITAGHSIQYLRMSEMNLGSSNTNGLKWMAIAACNSLFHTDWSSMQSQNVKPYNSNLHLLLGTDTVVWTDDHILEKWAQYMTVGKGTNAPMKIRDAWINAAKDAYAQTGFNYTNAMKFAYAGDTACINDTLSSTNTPGGTWTYSSQQVWP